MKFIIWQYTVGWKWYWERVWFNLKRLFHFFSFRILLKTIFSPWKRLTADDEVVGFDIAKFFENLSFNLISSFIGAIVRLFLIFFCLIAVVAYLIISIPVFIIWLVIPFLGWGYYERDQKRSLRELKNLEQRIRDNPDMAGKLLFESEMGKFIKTRLEKKADEVLMSVKLTPEDLADFDGGSLEKIMGWFLAKSKITNELQKLEIAEDDLILAAQWWDRRQVLWQLNEQKRWNLGRPGIGWNLIFGYTPNLDKYSENLSLKQDFADHLIGREKVVRRMEEVMNSGKNILLIGSPGVGKMTVVYAFAEMAITGKLGSKLAYKKLLLLDYQAAMAGNSDRDAKRKVLAGLLREAERAGNIVLVAKNIFKITNADFEGNDYSEVIDSALGRGRVNMIAVSSKVDYERFLATDQRILKNFEVIEITPSTKEEAMTILLQAVEETESKNKIRFSVQAIRQILEGSDRYITETPFPEKVLELMDQVAAATSQGEDGIGVDKVNRVLSEKTGIAVGRLTENEKEKLGKLEEIISQELIGQEIAVELISKSLRSRVAAVKDENKPIGSFLFLGPTGVGKTQTAKVLADVYYGSRSEILRFDMAEYKGSEGLERLIGSSVFKNQPGALTTQIKNKPASLLLLDEIEKASPEIYNLFLTILDEGYLNDAAGNKIVCRHLFVVATSNAGANFIREQINKGLKGEELQKSVIDFVQKQGIFSPEFLNRFDGVAVFEPVEGENLVKIAKLMLKDLQTNLLNKNINLELTPEVAEKVARDGFNIEFGARPMKRLIDLVVGDLLGRAILENQIVAGDKIKLLPGEGKDEYRWEKV